MKSRRQRLDGRHIEPLIPLSQSKPRQSPRLVLLGRDGMSLCLPDSIARQSQLTVTGRTMMESQRTETPHFSQKSSPMSPLPDPTRDTAVVRANKEINEGITDAGNPRRTLSASSKVLAHFSLLPETLAFASLAQGLTVTNNANCKGNDGIAKYKDPKLPTSPIYYVEAGALHLILDRNPSKAKARGEEIDVNVGQSSWQAELMKKQ